MPSPTHNPGNAIQVVVEKKTIMITHRDLGKMRLPLAPILALEGTDKLTPVESMVLEAALQAGFMFNNDEIRTMAQTVLQAVSSR